MADDKIILHDYWRSSTSYRVRIALHLKNIAFETRVVNLLEGAQKQDSYRQINPQGTVPSLEINGKIFTQSLAIIEYLDALYSNAMDQTPRLIPENVEARQFIMAVSHAIAMEIHPICNLSVLGHLATLVSDDAEIQKTTKLNWMKHYINQGLENVETMLKMRGGLNGKKFLAGDYPSIAEICIIPQLYNAHRWGAFNENWQILAEIEANANQHDAFIEAHPEKYKP